MRTETTQKEKPIIFTKEKDIEFMQAIRGAYLRVFEKALTVDEAHRQLPNTLNLEVETESHWFRALFRDQWGSVPQKLLAPNLDQDRFKDAKQNSSANYTYTDNITGYGAAIIKNREKSFIQRDSWRAYGNIHNPQYYLIFAISERVYHLRSRQMTTALADEYDCLKRFIDNVTVFVGKYVNSGQENDPFHAYLTDISHTLVNMKNEVLFYLERESMTKTLNELIASITSYQGTLLLYLAYCLSNAELDNTLNVGQFNREQTEAASLLPKNFLDSPIYQSLALFISDDFNASQPITRETVGLSSLIKTHGNIDEVQCLFDAYHALRNILYSLATLIKSLTLMTANAQLNGDYKVAHNPILHTALMINLEMVSSVIVQCQNKMLCINQINQRMLKGKVNYTLGAKLNVRLAEGKTDELRVFAYSIVLHQSTIQKRINLLRMMDLKTLQSKQEELTQATENTLTSFQKSAIISVNQAEEWRSELTQASNSSAGNESTSGNLGASCPQAAISIQGESTMRSSSVIKSDSEPPIQRQKKKRTLTQREFSKLYPHIKDHPHLIAEFEEKLTAYCQATKQELNDITQKFEDLCKLRKEIESECERLNSIKTAINVSEFERVDKIFQGLESTANSIRYANISFQTFQMLANFISSFYNRKEEQFFDEINRLLTNSVPKLKDVITVDTVQTTLLKQIEQEISDYIREKLIDLSQFATRLGTLKKSLENDKFKFDCNVVVYYRDLIKKHKNRLLPSTQKSGLEIDDSKENALLPQVITPSHTTEQEFPEEEEITYPEAAKLLKPPPEIEDDYEISITTLLSKAISKNDANFSKEESDFISEFEKNWSNLFNSQEHPITQANLKENLKKLEEKLYKMSQYVQYSWFFGGSKLSIKSKNEGKTTKKFQKYIKEMLEIFQKTEIDNLSVKDLIEFRNSLRAIAEKAKLQSENSYCRYGLFQVRHRVTERVYDVFLSATPRKA